MQWTYDPKKKLVKEQFTGTAKLLSFFSGIVIVFSAKRNYWAFSRVLVEEELKKTPILNL